MKKPEGYDETQAYGEYETLPAGGYKCFIKKVVCEKAQNGKEYLKLAIDILEGNYKEFYKKKYENDTRTDKKWGGTWTIFTEGYEAGTTNPKFKGLITSIEESNREFKFDFSNENSLEDKILGIVFREEEFEGQDGQVHIATKPFYAVPYDKVENIKVPEVKRLSVKEESSDTQIVPSDDDLPF